MSTCLQRTASQKPICSHASGSPVPSAPRSPKSANDRKTTFPARANCLVVAVKPASEWRQAGCATASAERFLTWRDPRPRTPSSELVALNSKRRHGSGSSDDHARRDQLKLDVPVKPDGPVDGHVEFLSDQKRPVGSEAQSGAAHIGSATGPGFNRPTATRDAVPNLQVQRKADATSDSAVGVRIQPAYPPGDGFHVVTTRPLQISSPCSRRYCSRAITLSVGGTCARSRPFRALLLGLEKHSKRRNCCGTTAIASDIVES